MWVLLFGFGFGWVCCHCFCFWCLICGVGYLHLWFAVVRCCVMTCGVFEFACGLDDL